MMKVEPIIKIIEDIFMTFVVAMGGVGFQLTWVLNKG